MGPPPGAASVFVSLSIQIAFHRTAGLASQCSDSVADAAAYAVNLAKGGTMSLQSRIETLIDRHAILEHRIADEDHRPQPDSDALARLKVGKLRLKEEMERLRS